MDTNNIDIWEDTICMGLLREGIQLDVVDLEKVRGLEKE
jgi:hypothetical protein